MLKVTRNTKNLFHVVSPPSSCEEVKKCILELESQIKLLDSVDIGWNDFL